MLVIDWHTSLSAPSLRFQFYLRQQLTDCSTPPARETMTTDHRFEPKRRCLHSWFIYNSYRMAVLLCGERERNKRNLPASQRPAVDVLVDLDEWWWWKWWCRRPVDAPVNRERFWRSYSDDNCVSNSFQKINDELQGPSGMPDTLSFSSISR